MRKVVLMMSVSLDGFIEGPNREIDWHMVDDELHSHFNEEAKMGASTGPMVEFARIWRDKPKLVFSRTLERAEAPA
jgi:dihydrofolate reductase